MFNRLLLLGAGAFLAAGIFTVAYLREDEAVQSETVIALEDGESTPVPADGIAEAAPPPEPAEPVQESVPDKGVPVGEEIVAMLKKPTPTSGTVLYACPDGRAFAVTYEGAGKGASITIGKQTVRLAPVAVQYGHQYTDGVYLLHAEGELAALIKGEQTLHDNCQITRAKS